MLSSFAYIQAINIGGNLLVHFAEYLPLRLAE